MDFWEFEKGYNFKFYDKNLGQFCIIGGRDSQGKFYKDSFLQAAGQSKNPAIYKRIYISWKIIDEDFLLLHFSSSIYSDLFPTYQTKQVDLSEFLNSGCSLAFYNGKYNLQRVSTHNYRIVLSFDVIREGFIELLSKRRNIRLVSSVKEYESVCEDNAYYRGHASISFDLLPGLYRDNWDEKELISDASRYLPFGQNNYINLTWMQHYGLPTRLLDVTKDRYVALYMACNTVFNRDSTINDLGKVYVFHPDELITIKEAHDWCETGREFEGVKYVEFQTIKDNKRLEEQKGSFIIFGKNLPLDQKPAIYVTNKKKILEELDEMDYSEKRMTPELEHVCHYLREKHNPQNREKEQKAFQG